MVITVIALFFQWPEFYKGYSYDSFNLTISIIFLFEWLIFSLFWGKSQEKNYLKFLLVYWCINIISAIGIYVFPYSKLIQSLLFPFYIWFGGPLYGFRYMFFPLSISMPSLILITSPLGILFSFIGYFLGSKALK
jgi:hydrogenase-4 membrane subunit HyfE